MSNEYTSVTSRLGRSDGENVCDRKYYNSEVIDIHAGSNFDKNRIKIN